DPNSNTCGYPAEDIWRYKPGGYHPVQLGDTFSHGRYRILHKLGWGGSSTNWLVRDGLENRNVALKVSSADVISREGPGEKRMLQALSTLPKSHPGHAHIVALLDSFVVKGPNGAHSCLVLELLGPSVFDTNFNIFMGYPFPASLAKKIASQVLRGIDLLSRHGIGHGDLHTSNLAFKIPEIDRLSEKELLQLYSKPDTEPVKRKDGGPIGDQVPPYLVDAAHMADSVVRQALKTDPCVKMIDFSEAFLDKDPPERLRTSITVRAPEVLFGDEFDRRVDLWALGCMLFELATAQLLFQSLSEQRIIAEILGAGIDDKRLPPRWQDKWHAVRPAREGEVGEYSGRTPHQWLEECYTFHRPELTTSAAATSTIEDLFSKSDLADISRLMGKLMKFEPGERAEACEVLDDAWFRGVS
ncbi:kinase-like domain-containing protein, partial [Microdochium bolleyi]